VLPDLKILSFFLVITPLFTLAQPQLDDFFVTGDAKLSGDRCFQLTYPMDWSSGGVWYKDSIDLSASFEMELKLMLGCDDVGGADGMVFVFAPYRGAAGYQGEGMGFAGLRPSLGIEIDTWENDHLADPPEDHIAILQDGYVMHLYNLAGPATVPNLEDCQLHDFRIVWDQPNFNLMIFVDGKETLSYQGDIVKNIFFDNPRVFWGVTSATGRYNNRHDICFERLEFAKPLSKALFGRVDQKKYLMGEVRTLKTATFASGQAELLEESYEELHKLINLLKRYPSMDVEIDGHTDSAGSEEKNLLLSKSRAKSIASYLERHGVDSKRLNVRGHGERFPVADNRTSAGRRENRRIEIHLYQAKT